MSKYAKVNELIIQTIEQTSSDENVTKLIKQSLQYELDIWNRHIFPSTIKDEYEHMVEKTIRGKAE